MDGMPGEQNQPVRVAQPPELSSPHFDETAVADAQPVEPLPPTRLSLANLSLQPIAIVMAFGLILIVVSVAAGFLIRSDRAAATASGAEQTPQPAPTEITPAPVSEPVAAAAGNSGGASEGSRKVGKRVRSQNRITPIVTDEEGRPGARKVGEIRYGRSADRP